MPIVVWLTLEIVGPSRIYNINSLGQKKKRKRYLWDKYGYKTEKILEHVMRKKKEREENILFSISV